MKIFVFTFAAGPRRWIYAAQRLKRQVAESPFLGHGRFQILTEPDLAEISLEWKMLARRISLANRGYGWYAWKPHALMGIIERLSGSVDFILFLDAGYEVNPSLLAAHRWTDYLEYTSETGLLVMRTDLPLEKWTKQLTLEHFELSPIGKKYVCHEAGLVLYKSGSLATHIIQAWRDATLYGDGLLFDERQNVSVSPDFVTHRHDQSVLSCLLAKQNLLGYPADNYFPNSWGADGRHSPFWAMRNRYPVSIRPGTLGNTVFRTYARLRRMPHVYLA